ncbi:glycosyltransferase [Catenulispora sp. NF23]|uniref:glycosyltransferase n=1 Tax=Catenulispora pinistramenti TaxID=2705254 RepID=UPI001BA63C25|nr:glycosyltransferase [Catenulispora pinistramenti]MBS2539380.1 glycosyltransferase [Catenulispora pinistramenti]
MSSANRDDAANRNDAANRENAAGDHPLRILLVRPESTGGIGVHVDSLTRALREAGHDVRTLIATGTGAIPAIRHAARQSRADVVHAHGLRVGAAACLATRKRTVVTLHNAPTGRAGEVLLRLIAQRADAVLAASHELLESATGHGARNAQFAPVVAPPLPAPTRPAAEVRAELKSALGLAPDDQQGIALAVGRLAPQKDYDTLLKALILVQERHGAVPPVAIAGEGPQRTALQAVIDAHALPVALLGHRTDVADLLRAVDTFVMCSTWEARPLALQEALRAGVPRVIATDVGGVAEVTAGRLPLIPAGDPEALARALLAAPAAPTAGWDALWPGPEDELAAVLAAYSAGCSPGPPNRS